MGFRKKEIYNIGRGWDTHVLGTPTPLPAAYLISFGEARITRL